jgi:glutaminase
MSLEKERFRIVKTIVESEKSTDTYYSLEYLKRFTTGFLWWKKQKEVWDIVGDNDTEWYFNSLQELEKKHKYIYFTDINTIRIITRTWE